MTVSVQPHNIHDLAPDDERGLRQEVAVVIPAYNRPELLSATVESLSSQALPTPRFEVHVVDDGSDEDLESIVRGTRGLDIHYHRQQRQGFGAARARNLGAAMAGADVVVFLDSDCLVPPGFVLAHASWHEPGGRTVVVGSRTSSVEGVGERSRGRERLVRRTSGLQYGSEIFRSFVSSNVSVPLPAFSEAGGFDERFMQWGGEDTELGWRLWQRGMWFVDDPRVTVEHQLSSDTSGGKPGRQRARALNDSLITSLIPHRFYRNSPLDVTTEIPKVSVILHEATAESAEQVWHALEGQAMADFELLVVADPAPPWTASNPSIGETRLGFASDLDRAIGAARGEYICFLSGIGIPRPTLLQDTVRRLDSRPFQVTATVGYALPASAGGPVRSRNGAVDVDRAWNSTMPLCWFIRTREAVKLEQSHIGMPNIWFHAEAWDMNLHVPSAAVTLPAIPSSRPDGSSKADGEHRGLAGDRSGASSQPMGADRSGSKWSETGSPLPVGLESAAAHPTPGLTARYVGWTGKDNLGDELMLGSVRDLVPWAEVRTQGDPRHLLILGGGTLINRHTYLKWILQRDSPRIERAVLGTGVASPEFWGETEDPARWKRWLSSCSYVGLRGPHSAAALRSWGYEGQLEICGDPALMVRASEGVERIGGRMVVAPLWARGELWGGSDESVAAALATAVRLWLGSGGEVVFLASSPEDDGFILRLLSEEVGRLLPYVAGYLDHQRAIDLIASAGVVVGERLHACVVAAAVGTPFVALEYQPKVRDFAASIGAEDAVVRTDQLDPGSLFQKAEATAARGPVFSRDRVDEYRRRLVAAGETIRAAMT